MADGDTLVNAAIGGAVAVVTSVLLGPASLVVGFGALGGIVGAYVARETDLEI